MTILKRYKKQLLDVILISTPLLGFFSVAPIVLYVPTRPTEELLNINLQFKTIVILTVLACGNVLFQWLINIGLMKYFYQKEKYLRAKWKQYISAFILVFIYSLVLVKNETSGGVETGTFMWYPVLANFAITSFILLLINLIINRDETERLKLEKAELEISQLLIQQEQLKQQIHPHFLFNALTTLQILIKKDGDKALLYATQLAKYLRASLHFSEQDIVTLKEELTFVENYLQLQQMRFNESIQYQFKIPSHILTTAKLPVFSLQLLAENAIKHNSFSKSDPLSITIYYDENGYIWVNNNHSPKFLNQEERGIGLKNIVERFRHFTNDLPEIIESPQTFKVKLKILGI